MTVKEYNNDFLPKIDRASGFVSNLDNSMYKTDDRENIMKQLTCIGWSDESKEIIKTALEFYKNSIVVSEVKSDALKKKSPMMAYYGLQDWLYDKGKDKPIEVKSAMTWGALWVLHHSGEIDWNEMRNMYGEYMSFATGMR